MGTAGTTEPGTTVTAVNETTGETTTVIAGDDGSFSISVNASTADDMTLLFIDESNNQTTYDPGPVRNPDGAVVVGNTPDKLGELCRRAKRHVQSSRLRPPAILVNAWNEWTEGSALLPDKHYKTAYLDELSKAFE